MNGCFLISYLKIARRVAIFPTPSFEYKREKANVFLNIKNNNQTSYNIHASESYIYCHCHNYLKVK